MTHFWKILILNFIFVGAIQRSYAKFGFCPMNSPLLPDAVKASGQAATLQITLYNSHQKPLAFGTAFLLNNQRTLLTARHVIEPVEPMGSIVPIEILTSQGIKIWPQSNSSQARIFARNENDKAWQRFDWRFKFDSLKNYVATDFAIITLNSDLSKEHVQALQSASVPRKLRSLGEEVYALGYPEKTYGRSEIDLFCGDAPGSKLRASRGRNLKMETHLTEVFSSDALPSVVFSWLYKFLAWLRQGPNLYIDAGIMNGMSGGPIVDSEGKVLGLVSRGGDTTQEELSEAARKGYTFPIYGTDLTEWIPKVTQALGDWPPI